MENEIKKVQALILKQAIRDLSSVNPKTREEALVFFSSKDFLVLSEILEMDAKPVLKAVKELYEYPILSRKKLTEEIAKTINMVYLKKKTPSKKLGAFPTWRLFLTKYNLVSIYLVS